MRAIVCAPTTITTSLAAFRTNLWLECSNILSTKVHRSGVCTFENRHRSLYVIHDTDLGGGGGGSRFPKLAISENLNVSVNVQI